MRELPEPEIISKTRDLSCPSCHTALREQHPIHIGYTRDQVLAIQRQAYEDGLRDAAKFFSDNDTLMFWGSQAARHILNMLTASQKEAE